MDITNFTVEETQLIALYMPKDSRLQLIRAIVSDKNNQEDMAELATRTVDKLCRMTDAEFLCTEFLLAM